MRGWFYLFDGQGRSAECDILEIIVDYNLDNCPVLFHVITLFKASIFTGVKLCHFWFVWLWIMPDEVWCFSL